MGIPSSGQARQAQGSTSQEWCHHGGSGTPLFPAGIQQDDKGPYD